MIRSSSTKSINSSRSSCSCNIVGDEPVRIKVVVGVAVVEGDVLVVGVGIVVGGIVVVGVVVVEVG